MLQKYCFISTANRSAYVDIVQILRDQLVNPTPVHTALRQQTHTISAICNVNSYLESGITIKLPAAITSLHLTCISRTL